MTDRKRSRSGAKSRWSRSTHEPYVVFPPAGRLSIHHAPLLVTHEEWRLLVDECNEADGQCRLDAGEEARNLEKGRNAARVVIGARAAGDRVVVRADQKDFAITRAAAACDFEVQATNSRDVIGKPLDGIVLLLPFVLDV